ncbi:recombinase family protein [Microbacterium sp. Root166]|uniref:recombinase family protein n=1 Tax=Microbacterium sp. Root166 TaxID=1736478 RepID=UPI001F2CDF43|nr:recombinase family protein [Microbacterium sp. Root166]
MAKVGYARVSTRDQNPDAQTDALTAAGCIEVFVDRADFYGRQVQGSDVVELARPDLRHAVGPRLVAARRTRCRPDLMDLM